MNSAQITVTACPIDEALRGYRDADPAIVCRSSTEVHKDILEKGKLSAQRARIFARDIRARLRGKGPSEIIGLIHDCRSYLDRTLNEKTVGVTAANSIGNLAGAMVAQQALSFLKYELPVIDKITADYSAVGSKLNQAVYARIVGQPAVQSYNPISGYSATPVTDTDVPVTITAHRYVQIDYNSNELASTGRNLFTEQAFAGIYSLAEDYVLALYALLTSANYTNKTVIALGSFNRTGMIGLGTSLFNRKVPRRGRSLLLNAAYYGQLMQDPSIVSFDTFQNADGITEYTLPRIGGFDIGCAADLPGNSINLTGVAFTKQAIVGATRILFDYVDAQLGSTYGANVPVTDPDTGLVVGLTQYVNHDAGVSRWRVALMYGCAVGDAARAQLLASA